MSEQDTERLQKYLARCGVASRRAAERLVAEGRVSLNGVPVTEQGVAVHPSVDVVAVDGIAVQPLERHHYVALNKPPGYVTTLKDPQGRATVAEFIPAGAGRLFPIGRLDRDTRGLLLLTDDGALANRLMHPRFHVSKTYLAHVDGVPDEADLRRLRDGVALDDGPTRPAEVALASSGTSSASVRITIAEGRKRQVRRMFSAVGHPVIELTRVAYGPLVLGDLAEGETRELTAEEVGALETAAGLP